MFRPLAGEANSDSLLSRQYELSTVKVIAHFFRALPPAVRRLSAQPFEPTALIYRSGEAFF